MTPERWRQISGIFHAARQRDPREQDAFLAEACGDDHLLVNEVKSLLAAGSNTGFGSSPLVPRPAGRSSKDDASQTQDASDDFERTVLPLPDITAFARGRYVVTRLLGEGGQKRVYLTYDTHLDRDVVIAVLKASLFNTGIARLQLEARALARLGDHPHIVTVHDIGEELGQPYRSEEHTS